MEAVARATTGRWVALNPFQLVPVQRHVTALIDNRILLITLKKNYNFSLAVRYHSLASRELLVTFERKERVSRRRHVQDCNARGTNFAKEPKTHADCS